MTSLPGGGGGIIHGRNLYRWLIGWTPGGYEQRAWNTRSTACCYREGHHFDQCIIFKLMAMNHRDWICAERREMHGNAAISTTEREHVAVARCYRRCYCLSFHRSCCEINLLNAAAFSPWYFQIKSMGMTPGGGVCDAIAPSCYITWLFIMLLWRLMCPFSVYLGSAPWYKRRPQPSLSNGFRLINLPDDNRNKTQGNWKIIDFSIYKSIYIYLWLYIEYE